MIVSTSISPQTAASPLRLPPARRVAAEAERRLHKSSYPSHRGLRCGFRDGVLTLEGRVSSYYSRQMACAMVANLEGVESVVDRMEVVEPARPR